MIMNAKRNRPLLRGTLISVVQHWHPVAGDPTAEERYCTIAVWCPFCGRNHYHGWNPADDGSVTSHRAAHCTIADSPFKATGYFISTLRKKDPGYACHVVKPGKPIVRTVRIANLVS